VKGVEGVFDLPKVLFGTNETTDFGSAIYDFKLTEPTRRNGEFFRLICAENLAKA